jgi:hypothetical protein
MRFKRRQARVFLIALAISIGVTASSFGQGVLLLVQRPPPPSGCTQATTFLARTSGLSGTETTAYTNLICGMVTDGTWSLLDALYIFATNTTTTAKLNLISTSFPIAYHGTPAESSQFSADHGYTGDGSTVYLDTGFIPSSAGGVFTLNSAHIGQYMLTSRTAASIWCDRAIPMPQSLRRKKPLSIKLLKLE